MVDTQPCVRLRGYQLVNQPPCIMPMKCIVCCQAVTVVLFSMKAMYTYSINSTGCKCFLMCEVRELLQLGYKCTLFSRLVSRKVLASWHQAGVNNTETTQ